MIVGTAGHIDHGKTALVQALTGVNTDRLPEEKRRGITIELGYAFMDAPGGQRIGFVDAPGHEKLVRTMVAGASGIDFALLLIAADDGAMPQTLEHLSILSLLGITHGAVVITKIDRVEPALVEQRVLEAEALLASHGLTAFTIMRVSALRGDGVQALRDLLIAQASQPHQAGEAQRGFRMGLDRVFTLEGVGTVVAGSIAAGEVSIGTQLCLAHLSADHWRVRSLHAQNRTVQQAHSGQRCAVGLAGLERSQVERGQTLCDPAIALTSLRLDAWLEVAGSESKPLRSGTQVHLHIATQDVTASVAVLGQSEIAPGQSALVQIVAHHAVAAWQGERLVLRDASATRTVAGGVVLDPLGPARYRQTPERLALLEGQRDADPARRFGNALAHAPHGIDGRQWLRAQGFRDWPFDPAALPGVVFDTGTQWGVASAQLERIGQNVIDALKAFHLKHPQDIGPDLNRARRQAAPRMPEPLWRNLIEALVTRGRIMRRSGFLHLPDHGSQLRESERVVAERALPMLDQAGFDPPWVRDIAVSTRIPEMQVRSVLARLAKTAEVFQIDKDLYYHPRQVNKLAAIARQLVARDGQIVAGDFRDATGLGRKRAIQILEFFDRIGFMRRVGDAHLLRPGTPLFPESTSGTKA